jgi:ankyrin repeat protein
VESTNFCVGGRAKSVVQAFLAESRVTTSTVECSDGKGRTALMHAAIKGHTSIVELFLADSRITSVNFDDKGRTALMHAIQEGHSSVVKVFLSETLVDKCCINEPDFRGLIRAVIKGNSAIVKLVLANSRVDKALIHFADYRGQTALVHAVKNRSSSIVEMLLGDSRVDRDFVDHADDKGKTALMHAVVKQHPSIVKMLTSTSRSTWHSIVAAKARLESYMSDIMTLPNIMILSTLNAELARRRMRVIYPPINRQLWPVLARGSESSGNNQRHTHSALLQSFFNFRLFDVNVLRIIRVYAAFEKPSTSTRSKPSVEYESEYLSSEFGYSDDSHCHSHWARY